MVNFSNPPLPVRKKHDKWPNHLLQPTLAEILNDICNIFGESPEEMMSLHRPSELVTCRMIYCYVANVLTSKRFNAISFFIKKDHSTYYYYISTAENCFQTRNKEFMFSWGLYENQSKIWKSFYEQHIKFNKKAA